MSDNLFARRTFLTATAAAAGAVAFGAPAAAFGSLAADAPPAPPRDGDAPAVRLGVASYSLRKFSREKAIEMTKTLRTPWINFKSVHLDYDAPDAEFETTKRELAESGLTMVGGGTITFDKDTDEGVQRYFEYAKRAGMPVMVATGTPAVMPRVERFAKQYDIQVAIHNHGPEDKHFPSPYDVLKLVKSMDRRMGLCMDIGHATRAGADIVQAAADAGPRLFDLHTKDLRDPKAKESQCIVGEGVLPIADLFRQLQKQRFPGVVNLEYEIDENDPFPGMQRSFAYMRGVLAGITPSTRKA